MDIVTERYSKLIEADNTQKGDVERLQLLYVIARTDEFWECKNKIYDTNNHAVVKGWDKLYDGTYGKMLQRTMHLFNSINDDIATVKLFWGLDDYNSQTMINAQMIYCGL